MQEYLFDKEALRKLIESTPDRLNRIAVRTNPDKPQDTIWARPVRWEKGNTTEDAAFTNSSIPGCPNPPGC